MSRFEDEPLDLIDDEEESSDIENKYLVVDIANSYYVMPIIHVKEIIPMPNIIALPGKENDLRGIIKVRNETYPLVDLRTLFSLPSLEDEDAIMIKMLVEREKDHINYIDELVASVRDKRAFLLNTDPHECTFGQWYDSFKTDNLDLSIFLSNFDLPHKRIHGVAVEVQEVVKRNDFAEAERIIDTAKHNELKLLMELFKEAPKQIRNSHRELSIIIEKEVNQFAVSADKVVGIAEFTEEQIEQKRVADKTKYIKGIANDKNYSCLIIDIEKLYTA